MKRLLLSIIFIALSFLMVITNNQEKLYDHPLKINQRYGDYIYNEFKSYITILKYTGSDKEVVIPNKINKKPVYTIDDSAFYGNQTLEKVTIPKNAIRIGYQTFIGNDNLKEVYLSDNLTEIGNWAFDVCPKLEKIYVKKGSKSEKALKKTPFKKYIAYVGE